MLNSKNSTALYNASADDSTESELLRALKENASFPPTGSSTGVDDLTATPGSGSTPGRPGTRIAKYPSQVHSGAPKRRGAKQALSHAEARRQRPTQAPAVPEMLETTALKAMLLAPETSAAFLNELEEPGLTYLQ